MKKPDWKTLLPVALAALAVFVAWMPNSVTIHHMPQDGMEPLPSVYCSYFTLLEDVAGAISLPAAALCACICLMLAGIYAVIKKKGLMTAVKWFAVISAILSVILILVMRNSTILIVPNMVVPIAMMVEFAVAHYLTKKADDSQKKTVKNRLK